MKYEPVYRKGVRRLKRSRNIETSQTRIGALAVPQAHLYKKLIRAAHAKEKQLPEELVQPPESP